MIHSVGAVEIARTQKWSVLAVLVVALTACRQRPEPPPLVFGERPIVAGTRLTGHYRIEGRPESQTPQLHIVADFREEILVPAPRRFKIVFTHLEWGRGESTAPLPPLETEFIVDESASPPSITFAKDGSDATGLGVTRFVGFVDPVLLARRVPALRPGESVDVDHLAPRAPGEKETYAPPGARAHVLRVEGGVVTFGAVTRMEPGASLEISLGSADGRIRELHQRTSSAVDIDLVVSYL